MTTTIQSISTGAAEGEHRKAAALDLLAARREVLVRRAQRALLAELLESGRATADDVRGQVEVPKGVNPKCFGAAPVALARAGIITADGYAKTCRPMAHARPVSVWTLRDPDKAQRWLRDHPDLLAPADPAPAADLRQGELFGEGA